MLPLSIAAGVIKSIPREYLVAAGIALILLTVVVTQRCTIGSLEGRLEKSQERVAELDAAHQQCMAATRALEAGNKALAASIDEQNAAVEALQRVGAATQAEADRLLAAADRRIAEKARAMDLLAHALRHAPAASECPAGDAVQVVRRALK